MVLIIFGGIVIMLICIMIVTTAGKSDESITRALLRKEAQKRYPTHPLSTALDVLYKETLRTIRNEHKRGNYNTEDLEERLIHLWNERNAAFIEEFENETT